MAIVYCPCFNKGQCTQVHYLRMPESNARGPSPIRPSRLPRADGYGLGHRSHPMTEARPGRLRPEPEPEPEHNAAPSSAGDPCVDARPMPLHDAPCSDDQHSLSEALLRALLCGGAAAVRGVLAADVAAAAAAEVDLALLTAERRAVDHPFHAYDDRRSTVSQRWPDLHDRWERRLHAVAARASDADRAVLVARQAIAETLRHKDDDRFIGAQAFSCSCV